MMKTYKAALAASAVAVLGMGAAQKNVDAEPLDVTATVILICEITANPMIFGDVEAGVAATATSNIDFSNCDPGTGNQYKIMFDQGTFGDATSFRVAKDGLAAGKKIAYSVADIGGSGLFTGGVIDPDAESLGTDVASLTLSLEGTLDATELSAASGGDYSDQIQITVDLTS